jgi:hypothetical protein
MNRETYERSVRALIKCLDEKVACTQAQVDSLVAGLSSAEDKQKHANEITLAMSRLEDWRYLRANAPVPKNDDTSLELTFRDGN